MSGKLPNKRRPGRPKTTDTMQTMEQILRMAARLFMDQGFEKVSLEMVASACGVTKASVYYYFSGKSELFTRCVVFVLSIAHRSTKTLLDGDGDLRERLKRVAIARMRNPNVEFETMMREASYKLTEEQIREIRDSEQALHELVAAEVQKAIDSGEVRKCNPYHVSHYYTSMLAIRNRQGFMQTVETLEEIAEGIMDVLYNGIQPARSNAERH